MPPVEPNRDDRFEVLFREHYPRAPGSEKQIRKGSLGFPNPCVR